MEGSSWLTAWQSQSQSKKITVLVEVTQPKPEQFEEYDRVIKDQLDMAIIERADQSEKAQPCHQIHYLPHHCVVREDKSTTKLRIVYNASARENRPALNDCLHTGPPLTPEMLDILIRFKVQPIALVADIEKAFLMIAVKDEDRELFEWWVVQVLDTCVKRRRSNAHTTERTQSDSKLLWSYGLTNLTNYCSNEDSSARYLQGIWKSYQSHQRHEWNLPVQGNALQLVSTGNT